MTVNYLVYVNGNHRSLNARIMYSFANASQLAVETAVDNPGIAVYVHSTQTNETYRYLYSLVGGLETETL